MIASIKFIKPRDMLIKQVLGFVIVQDQTAAKFHTSHPLAYLNE